MLYLIIESNILVGYEFAYFYAETNVTRLNISNYPYSDTASDYKSQLTVLKSQALAAIQNRVCLCARL